MQARKSIDVVLSQHAHAVKGPGVVVPRPLSSIFEKPDDWPPRVALKRRLDHERNMERMRVAMAQGYSRDEAFVLAFGTADPASAGDVGAPEQVSPRILTALAR